MKKYFFTSVAALSIFLFSCEESKYPLSSLPKGDKVKNIGDTVFVQQNPAWSGFNNPQAIIVGNEPLVYVADTDNDRIVMMDLSGYVIGYSKYIKHPIGLAQDKLLRLIVCAEFDTVLQGRTAPTTFGAVYKIDLFAAKHNIATADVHRVYYEPSDTVRRFTAVATLSDNQYYITRVGPNNDKLIDNDIAVMQFSSSDRFLTTIPELTPGGTGIKSLHNLTGIATMPTGRSVEFVISQTGDKAQFKVQWIRLISAGQTTNWESKFDPKDNPDLDIFRLNHFTTPEGVALDGSGNLYVIDAGKDSLFRFTTLGIEKYSFGGLGSGPGKLNNPHGVAYFDRTLYIADTGNNRIVRFKLSTDL
ncbi:MAG: hypothetical protein PHP42_13145 [Bacteroidota bacterium]|nr:hypothetical protein [Bacteroidota bacterium]